MSDTGDDSPKWFYRSNGTIQWLADRPGYIYLFAASDGTFKIGRSCQPESRRKAIQNERGVSLTLVHKIHVPDMKAAELRAHRMFKRKAISPYYICEWYELVPEDVERFKSLTAADLCPAGVAK